MNPKPVEFYTEIGFGKTDSDLRREGDSRRRLHYSQAAKVHDHPDRTDRSSQPGNRTPRGYTLASRRS
jgi:hypothetical protein